MPNLIVNDGSPSAYGFACGYVMRYEKGACSAELYKEHGTYHVRAFNRDKVGKGDGSSLSPWRRWHSTSKRGRARAIYRALRHACRTGKDPLAVVLPAQLVNPTSGLCLG